MVAIKTIWFNEAQELPGIEEIQRAILRRATESALRREYLAICQYAKIKRRQLAKRQAQAAEKRRARAALRGLGHLAAFGRACRRPAAGGR